MAYMPHVLWADTQESDDDGCFSAADCDGDGRVQAWACGCDAEMDQVVEVDLDDNDPNTGSHMDEIIDSYGE